jgi:hypothetical protein
MVMGGLQGAMNYVPEGESRATNAAEAPPAAPWRRAWNTLGARRARCSPRAEYLTRKSAARTSPPWPGRKRDDDFGPRAGARQGRHRLVDPAAGGREGVKAAADDAAKAGAPVTPAELARVVRAQNLPGGAAELTKGQMTGNRSQLRDEFNLRRTRAGESLDEQLVQQDKVLADSLDVIKLKTGGETVAGREAEAGQKITAPLLEQLKTAQNKVTRSTRRPTKPGRR